MEKFLNSMVSAVTAFDSYDDLYFACKGGYVPTIFGRSRRERILIRVLRADGFNVWGNKGKNW